MPELPERPVFGGIEEVTGSMLFDDGLPQSEGEGGYKGAIAAKAAGITYRQLDYWARTGLVEPSIQEATGSGSQRLYNFRDILVLKLVKRLLDTGISLQQIRVSIEQLRKEGVLDLAEITLMSDGVSVYLCVSSDEVIDLLSQGQGVFGIAVGKVLQEVSASLVDLEEHKIIGHSAKTQEVDELALKRSQKIS